MTSQFRHYAIEELLGAYALDAVDSYERIVIEEHLPTCARCRAEVQEHREVAALLAHTGATAPEGLWDRIADSLEGEALGAATDAPVLPRLSVAGFRQPGQTWKNRAAAGVLAAAAAVIAVLGVQIADQDQRLDEMAGLLELDALERAYEAAAGTPGSEVVEVRSADGRIDARAVVTEDGLGYLRASTLPPLAEGRTYQLWGDAGEQRVSLGPLGRDPEVVPFEVASQFVGLAITEEEAPGVIISQQPILAYGALPA